MNSHIEKLYNIAYKPHKIIIGLMSGTSLDGLDVALCKVAKNGVNTQLELLQFETINYTTHFKNEVQEIFCKENISQQKLCLLHNHIGNLHAQYVNQLLQKWNIKNTDVDVIASHGQTIYHAPQQLHQQLQYGNATLQIGDADAIAHHTGIITISDFRQKHIAAGGSGAPLALYGDYFLLSSKNENRILLNIGGIANFTYLPQTLNFENVICTDVGAGNTLMDTYIQQNFKPLLFDTDGAIAQQGNVNYNLLQQLLSHSFFNLPFPKSTGQEIFNANFLHNAMQASNTTHIAKEDVVATLNLFTATAIANAISQLNITTRYAVYISGGGICNATLIRNLQQLLPNATLQSTQLLGINPNAKEAILFAVLANETLCGNSNFYNQAAQHYPVIKMGKISFPC